MATPDRTASDVASLEQSLVISYLTLRKAVGFLGLMLPLFLLLGGLLVGCHCVKSSISDYYDSPLRNELVGILFAIALFFFSYNGYERQDRSAGLLAGIGAIGVALFPATCEGWVADAHYAFAGLLFFTLAYFSLFLFTKSDTDTPTTRKTKRNAVYVASGIIIIACLVLIAAYKFARYEGWLRDTSCLVRAKPVFVLEFLLLWAFGWSWVTKGEAILKDLPNERSGAA
jgi:hypothetical protein